MKEAKKPSYSKLWNRKEVRSRQVHNALSKALHWKLLKAHQICFPISSTNKTDQAGPFPAQSWLSSISQEITSIWGSISRKTAVLVSSLERSRGPSPFCLSESDLYSNIAGSTTPLHFRRMSVLHCWDVASGFLILPFTVIKTCWRAEPWSQITWPCSATEDMQIYL